MSFGFSRPVILIAAVIIIPLAAIILSKLKNPFILSIPLGAPGGVPFKNKKKYYPAKLIKLIEFISMCLLFVSAADPVIIKTDKVWLNRGADIIFIIDVSPSMAALDMDGKSRYLTAKTLVMEFAAQRPSDNIGIVAVGNEAALLIPPTLDREALFDRLEQLKVGEFGEETALGMGLAVAAYHLDKSNAKSKTVILITDGENNAGAIHPETAAVMLRETGAYLWVIGIGSLGEVPIDYIDPYTRVRRAGIYDSRFDSESLRRLSSAGGGTYIAAPSADSFTAAFHHVNLSDITVQRSRLVHNRQSCILYFLIPAVFLLAGVFILKRFVFGALI